jgi:hypothetical protein
MWIWPYVVVFVIPLVAAVAGVLCRNANRPRGWALVGSGIVGVAFAILAATTHDPEVPFGDAAFGVVAAGVLLGALPPYLFFLLGRALGEHRIALGAICAVASVPVTYYYLLGWILVLAAVHCPPDAYECPI